MDHQWATYSVIVIGTEVRVIPVESILTLEREAIGEIAAGRDGVLPSRLA